MECNAGAPSNRKRQLYFVEPNFPGRSSASSRTVLRSANSRSARGGCRGHVARRESGDDAGSRARHQPVERQSPNVDYMSHATESSDAYYYALVAALGNALEPSASEATVPK